MPRPAPCMGPLVDAYTACLGAHLGEPNSQPRDELRSKMDVGQLSEATLKQQGLVAQIRRPQPVTTPMILSALPSPAGRREWTVLSTRVRMVSALDESSIQSTSVRGVMRPRTGRSPSRLGSAASASARLAPAPFLGERPEHSEEVGD